MKFQGASGVLGWFLAQSVWLGAEPATAGIDFEALKARALQPANVIAGETGSADLPEVLRNLDYVGYREIEFRFDRAWWGETDSPFRVTAYHRGGLFRERVQLNEVAVDGRETPLAFSPDHFNYRALGTLPGLSGETDLGYAGWRALHELNEPGKWDEVASFLGASYFRALGRDLHYGLSARALAVDSGLVDRPEEFPQWREFWLSRPTAGDAVLRFQGIFESRRVVGVMSGEIQPGSDTVMALRVALRWAEAVPEAGWAPLTSMFWYGEREGERPLDEARPEVHDSDGLWVWADDAPPTWRALQAVENTTLTHVRATRLRGFGLLQRDRDPDHYQDYEAHYHRRPSAWVIPEGDWGPGVVRLVELKADREYADNVVAYWRPDAVAAPGTWVEYAYRLVWSGGEPEEGNP